MSFFNNMVGILAQNAGVDISVQHYTVSQSGSNPATAIITLNEPVPVGQSFAHIHMRVSDQFGHTAHAIARLQNIVNGHYTECLVLSESGGGYQNSYNVQIITSPDFSVQTVSFDQQPGDLSPFTHSISAADLNHSFIVPSFTGGNQPRRSVMRVYLSSDTNVETRTGISFFGENLSACHYVVSCPKINVQPGLVTLEGVSVTVPVANNTENTICLFSYYVDESAGNTTDADFQSIRGHWVSNSLYQFSREVAGAPIYISFFMITIPQTNLLRLDHAYQTDGTESIQNITIPNIGSDMSKVWVAVPSMLGNTQADAGSVRQAFVMQHVTSPTNLQLSSSVDQQTNLITSSQILML